MGLFSRKRIVKEITGKAWGHLVNVHKVDVDTLSNEFRVIEREGTIEGGKSVTFLRIFKPLEALRRNIAIQGWESLDQNPDLIYFEGYRTKLGDVQLERKR